MAAASVDVVVIGAGMAGASAAWQLADRGRVVLVEQAPQAGFHASGRSASLLNETSGHPVVCALASASRAFFESPPEGFVDHPLLHDRGLLWIGRAGDEAALDELAARARVITPTVRRLDAAATARMLPAFRAEAIAAGSVHEPDAREIDTAAMLAGYVAGLRARGGVLHTSTEAIELSDDQGEWTVVATDRTFRTPVVVNAAGAWGDVVAERAGVAPIGLEPRRRTASIVPVTDDVAGWPLVMDIAGRFYIEPDSGGLLLSPADETPSEPCDARPEELDVAIALDQLDQATTLGVRSVRHSWAGLRTFSRDGAPVLGEDPDAPGFWWLVGQAGAGIKTAPAMAAALAALLSGEALDPRLVELSVDADTLGPARFR